jgi:hypothetical protein
MQNLSVSDSVSIKQEFSNNQIPTQCLLVLFRIQRLKN